jgi:hypothetical protein
MKHCVDTQGLACLGLISLRMPWVAARPFQLKKPSLGLWRGESGLPVVVEAYPAFR